MVNLPTSITMTGTSGRVYAFLPHEKSEKFKEVGGVFLLVAASDIRYDGFGYSILRVVETDNLRQTLEEMEASGDVDYACTTHVCLLASEDAAERQQLLRDLAWGTE